MKKLIFVIALFAIGIVQNCFGQDTAKTPSGRVLSAYYQLKNNLVKSDPGAAASSADQLISAIKGIDTASLDGQLRNILIKDANTIAKSNDLNLQREKFATLSNNMIELAKKVKFTSEPIYQQYCPMKNASWLSHEKAIKNPYYGSAMLTCGSVKNTF